ncbi:hypothetical protein GCM10020295_37480 [Streptomyces cinereospinus]
MANQEDGDPVGERGLPVDQRVVEIEKAPAVARDMTLSPYPEDADHHPGSGRARVVPRRMRRAGDRRPLGEELRDRGLQSLHVFQGPENDVRAGSLEFLR